MHITFEKDNTCCSSRKQDVELFINEKVQYTERTYLQREMRGKPDFQSVI